MTAVTIGQEKVKKGLREEDTSRVVSSRLVTDE